MAMGTVGSPGGVGGPGVATLRPCSLGMPLNCFSLLVCPALLALPALGQLQGESKRTVGCLGCTRKREVPVSGAPMVHLRGTVDCSPQTEAPLALAPIRRWDVAPCTFSCGNQQSIFGALASVDPDSLTCMTAIHAVRGPLDYKTHRSFCITKKGAVLGDSTPPAINHETQLNGRGANKGNVHAEN